MVRRTAGDGYVLVVTLSMLVMRMIILVKREHYHKITNVKVRWMMVLRNAINDLNYFLNFNCFT